MSKSKVRANKKTVRGLHVEMSQSNRSNKYVVNIDDSTSPSPAKHATDLATKSPRVLVFEDEI